MTVRRRGGEPGVRTILAEAEDGAALVVEVKPIPRDDVGTGSGAGGSKVFLFNCNCHTFDDVIAQLVKAVPNMTTGLAEELAWRVHNQGLAEVYRGGAEDCDRVARVLGETGLIVQVH